MRADRGSVHYSRWSGSQSQKYFQGLHFEKLSSVLASFDVRGKLDLIWWKLALLRSELKDKLLRTLWITLSGERPWKRGRRVGKHAATRATPIWIIGQNSIRPTTAGEVVSISSTSYLTGAEVRWAKEAIPMSSRIATPKIFRTTWVSLKVLSMTFKILLTPTLGIHTATSEDLDKHYQP